MAMAVVRAPNGAEIERHERRTVERVWLTVQTQASHKIELAAGVLEERWRYPVGATVEIDGALYATLGSDRRWTVHATARPEVL